MVTESLVTDMRRRSLPKILLIFWPYVLRKTRRDQLQLLLEHTKSNSTASGRHIFNLEEGKRSQFPHLRGCFQRPGCEDHEERGSEENRWCEGPSVDKLQTLHFSDGLEGRPASYLFGGVANRLICWHSNFEGELLRTGEARLGPHGSPRSRILEAGLRSRPRTVIHGSLRRVYLSFIILNGS